MIIVAEAQKKLKCTLSDITMEIVQVRVLSRKQQKPNLNILIKRLPCRDIGNIPR